MKLLILVLISTFLVGCNKSKESNPKISVFSTGRGHPDESSSIIQSYGSLAIRVYNDPVEVRIYKVQSGNRLLEHQFRLDPMKHQLAWVTPSIVDAKVQIEFGMSVSSGGHDSTPHYYSSFESAKSVGTGNLHATRWPSEAEEMLLQYTIVKDDSVSLPYIETTSVDGLLSLSQKGLVDFYLVTVATK
jgi:hypothetical protein